MLFDECLLFTSLVLKQDAYSVQLKVNKNNTVFQVPCKLVFLLLGGPHCFALGVPSEMIMLLLTVIVGDWPRIVYVVGIYHSLRAPLNEMCYCTKISPIVCCVAIAPSSPAR